MKSEKSQIVAILLALFLGTIGIHRFYVGKVGTGILMLVLTITFFGMVITIPWAVLDFVMACVGVFRDSEGRKLG